MAGAPGAKGAINGTRSVLKPVMYAVVSTMIFFGAMLVMPGDMAQSAYSIPVVVILTLAFSLLECLLILPAHLAHMRPPRPSRFAWLRALEKFRLRFSNGRSSAVIRSIRFPATRRRSTGSMNLFPKRRYAALTIIPR